MSKLLLLPITFESGNTQRTIYPVMLQDKNQAVLVDCGYPGFMEKIKAALDAVGSSLKEITKVIITHNDHDHMGSLRAIKESFPSIEVLCSKEQAPFITGKNKSLRLIQAEKLQDSLPKEEQEAGLAFQALVASVEPVDAATIVYPGDVINCCGGIEIVDTKGHMPGHISLYIKEKKTLISGDALVIENGKLCFAFTQYALNIKEAQESVRRLLHYDIEKVICYHGGVYDTDVRNSLHAIISQFNE